MVKSIKDEIVQDKHPNYNDFLIWQYIADLNVGDKVEIKIEPKDGSGEIKREFVAKKINCHINCQWQDKGTKKLAATPIEK